jgi:hypothetical protein
MRKCSWFLFTLLGLLTACATPPITLPADFVELRDPGEGFRAVTADDARLRVRDLEEETDAGAVFWAGTLKSDLVQRGYEIVGEGAIGDRTGVQGQWLEWVANAQGERVGYLVAVWPRERGLLRQRPYLQVVEFMARDAVYQQRVEAVRKALGSVQK